MRSEQGFRAVGDDLAAFDLHVELAYLGDTQITQRLCCSLELVLKQFRVGAAELGTVPASRNRP